MLRQTMSYILVNNSEVTLAGMVASKEMLEQGYFEYTGIIPTAGVDEKLGWDDITKKIVVVSTLTPEIVRNRRNEKLQYDCDSMTVLRWGSLNSVQQAQWISYRQQLLDVPTQLGFPTNVMWPQRPTA